MTLKSAIIGAGRIARQHLDCLSRMKGVEVAAVCDLSPATAEAMAERYGVPGWYTDAHRMLEEVRPAVVHVTTPPRSHYPLARQSIEAGAHVLVEKPITTESEELLELQSLANANRRWLIEDHNLAFNAPVQQILELVRSGEFGEVVHVEVHYCLALGPDSAFCDRNAPHPCLALPGGAIADFLTHLAYLGYVFVGPHESVRTVWRKRNPKSPLPSDEMRALVAAQRGTALLSFSAHSQPDGCWVWVHGTRMRAMANLYTSYLALDRAEPGPKMLRPILDARRSGRAARQAAFRTIWRKISGRPLIYEGLYELIGRLYGAIHDGGEPPVSPQQIADVNRLVHDLVKQEYAA